MPTTWYEAVVREIIPETPQVRRFRLAIPALEVFHFQAGQFITFDLPVGEKRLQRWRSYSIASPPDGSNVLELCIARSPSGLGTRYFFEEVQVGTTLKFKGPEGTFVLPETLDHDVVMICTGTGIAPFRSMIADLHRRHWPCQRVHLIFGTRTENDILYRTELETLARHQPNFRYDVALSRQNDWHGHHGYVHPVYLNAYPQPHPALQFYLCGWTNMIDQAVAHLINDLHCRREQIHYELYG